MAVPAAGQGPGAISAKIEGLEAEIKELKTEIKGLKAKITAIEAQITAIEAEIEVKADPNEKKRKEARRDGMEEERLVLQKRLLGLEKRLLGLEEDLRALSKTAAAAAGAAGGGDAKAAAGAGEAASAQSLALSVTPPALYALVRVWSDAQDDETMACVVEMPDAFGDALLNVSLKTQIPQPSLKLYYFLNPAEAGGRVKVDGQAAYRSFVDYLRTIRTSLLFAYDARRPFASVPAPAHSTSSHAAAGAAAAGAGAGAVDAKAPPGTTAAVSHSPPLRRLPAALTIRVPPRDSDTESLGGRLTPGGTASPKSPSDGSQSSLRAACNQRDTLPGVTGSLVPACVLTGATTELHACHVLGASPSLRTLSAGTVLAAGDELRRCIGEDFIDPSGKLTCDVLLPFPDGLTAYDPRVAVLMRSRFNALWENGHCHCDEKTGCIFFSAQAMASKKYAEYDLKSHNGQKLRQPQAAHQSMWPPASVFRLQRLMAPHLRAARGDLDVPSPKAGAAAAAAAAAGAGGGNSPKYAYACGKAGCGLSAPHNCARKPKMCPAHCREIDKTCPTHCPVRRGSASK